MNTKIKEEILLYSIHNPIYATRFTITKKVKTTTTTNAHGCSLFMYRKRKKAKLAQQT